MQYVEPFLTVKIATMASSFGVPESSMLDQIVDLIHKGKIKGKVDLIDRVGDLPLFRLGLPRGPVPQPSHTDSRCSSSRRLTRGRKS